MNVWKYPRPAEWIRQQAFVCLEQVSAFVQLRRDEKTRVDENRDADVSIGAYLQSHDFHTYCVLIPN